jgi:hypothetical protein
MDQPKSPPAERNELKAKQELGMIAELQASTAFQWFEREFISKPYRASHDALTSPDTEDLKAVQLRFLVLRELKTALLRREYAMRRMINPEDSELDKLRTLLAAL